MFAFRFGNFALSVFALMVPLGGAAAQTDKPWIIGEVAPLTGPAATVGTRLNKAAKMWVDEVNVKGGINGRRIDHRVCNDENRPEKAVACTRDFIDQGAVIIFGNSLTASLRAMLPLVRSGPILLIPSPNVVPGPSTFAFQVSPTDEDITLAIAKYAQASNIKKIGMLAATDTSGEVGVASANKIFPAEKIELKLARIDLRATDASTQLANVASDDVGLVYSSYSGAGAITVVKSFQNLGLKQPLIVSYANISDAFVQLVKDIKPSRLLGSAVASVVPDTLKDPGERARSKAFIEAYTKKYSEAADMINVNGRAETDVADAILRKTPNPADYPAVKKWLETNVVESVYNLKFSPVNHVGADAANVVIVELKNNTWVPADPVK
jgi:ABC-type branched-subunit amino acid transport system substrate-binding protein